MTVSFSISPYLQEKMLYIGQKEVFSEGADTFSKLLQLKVCSSQIQRVCHYYGDLSELEEVLQTAHPIEEKEETIAKDSVLYVQVDGSNLLTEAGWKEVKLGRVFSQSDIKIQVSDYQGVAPRTTIEKSDYLAYKGESASFIPRFNILLKDRLNQSPKEMVFITDGETWIENWLKETYPTYPRILDYYHAVKPLKAFAEKAIKADKKRKEWLDHQKDLLLSSQVDKILLNLEDFNKLSKTAVELKQALTGYYQNNQHRMDYQTYLDKGWYIGSGAIESAHRVVIQQRMKLSGQRWGNNAQPILNLRATNKSDKWAKIIQLVNEKSFTNAA